jgi:hypothetical protein
MHHRDVVVLSYDRKSKLVDKFWSSCQQDQSECVNVAFKALRSQYRAIGLLLGQVSPEASSLVVPVLPILSVSVLCTQYRLISFLAAVSCYCL